MCGVSFENEKSNEKSVSHSCFKFYGWVDEYIKAHFEELPQKLLILLQPISTT